MAEPMRQELRKLHNETEKDVRVEVTWSMENSDSG